MIFSRFKWNKDTILELSRPIKAYIYYRTFRQNLLTGFPESYSIEEFQKNLGSIPLQGRVPHPTVYHFYYEYGMIEHGLGHLVDENAPLVVEIEYHYAKKKKPRPSRLKEIPLKTLERPNWSEYKSAFQLIQEELLDGNCYQANLTYPFDYITDEMLDPRDIADYFFSQKGLGSYAHATYFGSEMILSNSPECLFQYKKQEIFTMPIKGTMKHQGHDVKEVWKRMQEDRKEEGELLMITDLLKNDLNRLDSPSAKIIKLKAPLVLPGLLHQYSLIGLKLTKKVSLGETMRALFPGGSITGAPKRRVMEILGNIECFHRGIYCGSTVLCMGETKAASINIRTASINTEDRIWRYGAGGGITLLSKPLDEFKEMESKVVSFLTLLKLRGY